MVKTDPENDYRDRFERLMDSLDEEINLAFTPGWQPSLELRLLAQQVVQDQKSRPARTEEEMFAGAVAYILDDFNVSPEEILVNVFGGSRTLF